MSIRFARREGCHFYNSLTGLIKSLENKYTTIDLRNESCVTGRIVHVDGYMNVDLEDVMFYDARGQEVPFASFFIRSRNIRQVHVPEDVNMFEAIQQFGYNPNRQSVVKKQKKRTFKVIRAERRQRDTLQELALAQKKQE